MEVATPLEQASQHEQDQAWAKALEAYQLALTLDPTNAATHARLGVVSSRLGQLDRAEQHYRAALDLDPTRLEARHNLGMIHKKQGRTDEAQVELEEFLELARTPRDIANGKELLAELTGLSYEKCAKCGGISTLGIVFKSTLKGKLCPRCYPSSRVRRSALEWGCLGTGALALALLAYPLIPQYCYLLANGALTMILIYLLILPHELCHALAARLVGGQVFEIRFGMGPAARERRFGNLTLSLGRYPIGGLTMAAFPTPSNLRARLFVTVLAGLLFNSLMALLLAPAFTLSRFSTTYAPVEALALANLIVVAVNLFPRKQTTESGELYTDGLSLLRLLLGKLSADEIHLAYFLAAGFYASKQKAYAQVLEICDTGLATYPGHTLLLNTKAVALLELERHAEALALFEELLARLQAGQPVEEPGIQDTNRELVRALLLNNVAYASLLDATAPDARQKAYAYARQAFRTIPWIAHIQGTWGSVLVERGRIEEGIRHLLEASKHHDSARGKAANLAYAARGHHRLGDGERAAATLDKALALDATEYMVRKAQAELRLAG